MHGNIRYVGCSRWTRYDLQGRPSGDFTQRKGRKTVKALKVRGCTQPAAPTVRRTLLHLHMAQDHWPPLKTCFPGLKNIKKKTLLAYIYIYHHINFIISIQYTVSRYPINIRYIPTAIIFVSDHGGNRTSEAKKRQWTAPASLRRRGRGWRKGCNLWAVLEGRTYGSHWYSRDIPSGKLT